jgi:hypothetical protein
MNDLNSLLIFFCYLPTVILLYCAYFYSNKARDTLDNYDITISRNCFIAGTVFFGVGLFIFIVMGIQNKSPYILRDSIGLCLLLIPAILFMAAYLVVDKARKTANYNDQQNDFAEVSRKLAITGILTFWLPIAYIIVAFIDSFSVHR